MTWRTVYVTSNVRLSCRKRQLQVHSPDTETVSLPIEDIAAVIFESHQATLSVALLSGLLAAGAAVVVCDERHLPSGIMLPQFKHHRVTQIQQQQLQTSKPLLKRIWQKIVQSKIANQIDCLKYCKQQGIEKLKPLSEKVRSGDSGNVEAVAARLYWPSLFSKKFTRKGNGVLNDALNYGYAICRAAVARAVVGAGLNPGFGLHHANSLNPFNLADDLMEPLRPLVDRLVFKFGDELPAELNSGVKQQLLTVCDERLKISGEVLSLLRASEVMVASLLRCYEERSAELITLPELIP